ncbi:MAG: kelch repeat-containing protein [Dokdonella sp.]
MHTHRVFGALLLRACIVGVACFVFQSAAQANGFVTTGSLIHARSAHTATLLPSGRVLVAGGNGSAARNSAELYDPATHAWQSTGYFSYDRFYAHTATLLPTGKVLIVGGYGSSGIVAAAELYNPASGTWSLATTPSITRMYHTATLLGSGKVLVVGGYGVRGDGSVGKHASAQLYDPVANTWTSTGSLSFARSAHTATLLASGKVLVAGGADGVYLPAAEIYDPATGSWGSAGMLQFPRAGHAAASLASNGALIAGGAADGSNTITAEQYDDASNLWSSAGLLAAARLNASATRLQSGRVLVIAGGPAVNGSPLASAEMYDSAANAWSPAGDLTVPRQLHTATLLPDGSVLVAGGQNDSVGLLNSAELYMPATMTTITSSTPDQSVVGQAYYVTVTVNGAAGTPTGQVVLTDDAGASCGPVVVAGGTASCAIISTHAGQRTITATYAPDTGAFTASSATATHVVDRADTQLVITAQTPDPSLPNELVTVTAGLTVLAPGAGSPSGIVVIGDGIDSCTIGEGATSCELTLTTHGLRSLTAGYAGDGNFNASSAVTTHRVNQLPSSGAAAYVANEDTPLSIDAIEGVLAQVIDADGDPLSIANPGERTAGGIGGSVLLNANGSFHYSPPPNANGTASFDYQVSDGYQTISATATLAITAVNDTPSFMLSATPSWPAGESGTRSQAGFAGVVDFGAPDEDSQHVHAWLLRSISDPAGVASNVAIAIDGTLTYTLSGNAGSAQFGVRLQDDGGIENGGVDTSPEQIFTLAVAAGLDLSIDVDDGQTFAQGGLPADYTIVVHNAGPNDAMGARVRDTLPFNLTGASWTCVGSVGASCTSSGSGDIDDTVVVPSGGTLTYELSATVVAAPEAAIEHTVSVMAPANVPDLNGANDTSVDIDAVGIFADGFDVSFEPAPARNVEIDKGSAQIVSGDRIDEATPEDVSIVPVVLCRVGANALLWQQRIARGRISKRRLALRDANDTFVYSPWIANEADALLSWNPDGAGGIESAQLVRGSSTVLNVERAH